MHINLFTDINECNGKNKCDQVCVNTPGSYQCSCNEGYSLMDDGESCEGGHYLFTYKQSCQ